MSGAAGARAYLVNFILRLFLGTKISALLDIAVQGVGKSKVGWNQKLAIVNRETNSGSKEVKKNGTNVMVGRRLVALEVEICTILGRIAQGIHTM